MSTKSISINQIDTFSVVTSLCWRNLIELVSDNVIYWFSERSQHLVFIENFIFGKLFYIDGLFEIDVNRNFFQPPKS